MAGKQRPPNGLPSGDDGHTIVSMRTLDPSGIQTEGGTSPGTDVPPPSREETRLIMFASLKAALLLALIFSLAIVAFVALLLLVWR